MVVHRRFDGSRNMARFYALSLQRSLFGETLLVRRWGRIGTHGRLRSDWFDQPEAAAEALLEMIRVKTRRGYHLIAAEPGAA